MAQTQSRDPLVELVRLVEANDAAGIAEHLRSLPPEETGYLVLRLPKAGQTTLLSLLSTERPELAASLMEHLLDEHAAGLLSILPPMTAAPIVGEMDSDDRADVIGVLRDDRATAILDELESDDAAEIRRLIGYPRNTAGGLMITEYLAHPSSRSIDDVLADLRDNAAKYARYDVQYVYVTDEDGVLLGVLRLRDLVLSPGEQRIQAIMIPNPAHVTVSDSQARVEHFFDDHGFFAAPVVDRRGRLVGVVRRAAVERAHAEQADRALLAFGGIIGGEELRTMATSTRVVRRLAFLCPNILLNLAAASIVAAYEPTIAAITALAIFLPMLSDMSGCAGNQAVAVSIRELSLGLIRPNDVVRTFGKEIGVGIVNGAVLGTVIGLIAWAMRGGDWPLIGVVVGGAMGLNSIIAVVIGGVIPLLLKRANVDPALASSPILTTFTDMCGFFLTLSLATAVLL